MGQGITDKDDRVIASSVPIGTYQELVQLREQAALEGREIIDLSIGSPDRPPPTYIIERLVQEVQKSNNHGYPPMDGLPELRWAIAGWYKRKFGINLNPEKEVYPTIGAKEAIANLFRAVLHPGEGVLIPDPGYPTYSAGVKLAGGVPLFYPLVEEGGFLPDFAAFPPIVWREAKILMLNYPHNPTGAIAERETFSVAVALGREHGLLVCHDNPYLDITFDGSRPRSLLEIPGAKDVGLEFFSFSKLCNMAGWRLGCVVGNAAAIARLKSFKRQIDSGIFKPIQLAGATALADYERYEAHIEEMRRLYQQRRDLALTVLRSHGWEPFIPRGTLYLWTKIPRGWASLEFVKEAFLRTGVLVAPGVMYGSRGEGYIRISLVREEAVLKEALEELIRCA
jgi:LL-diaminopimelate aminotransferase